MKTKVAQNEKWISVTERLPVITDAEDFFGHKVITAWGNKPENTTEMRFCKRTVRNKVVFRFEWNGRISPFDVKYWMEFPAPPSEI